MSLNFKSTQKLNKNFMYNNLAKSNCFAVDFAGSNFNFSSLRGAHFKSCNFFGCSFKDTEFVGTNCKKSKFKNAKFEGTLFEGVNLNGADFRGATFRNVVFIGTDLSQVQHLDVKAEGITIYEQMPPLNISPELEEVLKVAMQNPFIKQSRVLDTKDGAMHTVNVMRLLQHFSEKELIKGFKIILPRLEKEFYTLSYLIKNMMVYKEAGFL